MRITIISDVHLGYGHGGELFNDSFENLRYVFENVNDCDAVLIAGDLFDEKIPKQEVIAKTFEIFSILRKGNKKCKVIKNGKFLDVIGIPVICIHGTHEYRFREFINPVQLLERAGFLIHLHCSYVELNKDTCSIRVYGMSGVPEQKAKDVLKEWNPKPSNDFVNIFMLHQNFEGLVPSQHFIGFDDIPIGFDLYVCGHVHEPRLITFDTKPFLIPGSLTFTQIRKSYELGYWVVNINEYIDSIKFFPLPNQRKVFIKKFVNPRKEDIDEFFNSIKCYKKKPIVKIEMSGNDEIFRYIKTMYSEEFILNIKRNIEKPFLTISSSTGKSIGDVVKNLLKKNCEHFKIDFNSVNNIIEMLENKDIDKAIKYLKEKFST